jgi:hypothetical protein
VFELWGGSRQDRRIHIRDGGDPGAERPRSWHDWRRRQSAMAKEAISNHRRSSVGSRRLVLVTRVDATVRTGERIDGLQKDQ